MSLLEEQLEKLQGLNEEQYIWELGQLKDSGLIDLDWRQIADIINEKFRTDETEYKHESAYRKTYQAAKRYYEAGVFRKYDKDSYIRELRETKQDLRKEKQKLFDERNELNRKLREQARKESFLEMLQRLIDDVKPISLSYRRNYEYNSVSDNDVICHLTDIHTGINIDNWFNKFNTDILKNRLWNYLNQLFDIQDLHGSENCYIIIGEVMSGLIHENLRLENNENVIQQFITISGLLSEFIGEIANHFNNVFVYTTPGNHSRVIAHKDSCFKGENFDILIPHYLKASLQNFDNVHIEDNYEDCDIARFNVRGYKVYSVHGDKDTPENVVQHFTMMFGEKPDIILLGHRHTNGLSTVYDTKVIQSGCISGADNFCLDKRLRNRPEQTISVVNNNGLLCVYDVKVDA